LFAEIVHKTGEKGTIMIPVGILPANLIVVNLSVDSRITSIRTEDEKHVSSR
jgi:hypothetical protein